MGCWNGTCGITQLSISAGEPVVYFLIANVDCRESHDNGFCHSEDIWCPIALPLYAEYNDYGSIEEIDSGEALNDILALLKRYGVPIPARNDFRPAFDPTADLDFDRLEDALHEGIVRIRDDCGFEHAQELAKVAETTPHQEIKDAAERVSRRPASYRVGLMMVHREIYEGLTQSYPHWLNEKPIPLSEVIQQAEEAYQKLVDRLKQDVSIIAQFGPMFTLEYLLGHEARNLFTEFFQAYPIFARQYIEPYAEKMIECAKNQEPLPAFLTEICRFQVFRCNMSNLRKAWSPQSGAGSQHDNHEDHAMLMGLTAQLIKKKHERYMEDEAETEEAED